MAPSEAVGVLAVQGDFAEHLRALQRLGVTGVAVRKPEELERVGGLILPGGESTTIGKLMQRFGLMEAVGEFARSGRPLYGTCAGLILMAREIVGSDQPRLGLMDIVVERNAYGRQVESFETELEAPALGSEPLRAVFIRAPRIRELRNGVQVLAALDGEPVLIRQGRCLAGAFHPELTADLRVHRYFAELVREQ